MSPDDEDSVSRQDRQLRNLHLDELVQVVTNDLELWHQDMQPVSYPVIGNQ